MSLKLGLYDLGKYRFRRPKKKAETLCEELAAESWSDALILLGKKPRKSAEFWTCYTQLWKYIVLSMFV